MIKTGRAVVFSMMIILIFVFGCAGPPITNNQTVSPTEQAGQEIQPNGQTVENQTITQNYVQFTLNVHDWVYPDKSAESVLKTIEIHEKYGVPVDIYVDDPIFQKYMEDYPSVVEKLKTSPVVVVSYHIRPPMPAYYQFDIFDLDSKSEDELYAFLKPYEENRTNLSTALVDQTPGGYQYVKDMIGYAPVAISFIMDTPEEKNVMGQIYKEKGALLGVTHNDNRTNFGENLYGLLARPEDIPIKWYEKAADHKFDGLTAEGYLTSLIEEHGDSGGLFINIKMHENDYYGTSTTFDPVYWNQSERGNPANVPFDISAGYTKFKTTQAMTNEWEWYESAVVYVAEHPELYIAIDNNDVVEMYREAGMLE